MVQNNYGMLDSFIQFKRPWERICGETEEERNRNFKYFVLSLEGKCLLSYSLAKHNGKIFFLIKCLVYSTGKTLEIFFYLKWGNFNGSFMWKESGVFFCKILESKEGEIWENNVWDRLPKSSVQMWKLDAVNWQWIQETCGLKARRASVQLWSFVPFESDSVLTCVLAHEVIKPSLKSQPLVANWKSIGSCYSFSIYMIFIVLISPACFTV